MYATSESAGHTDIQSIYRNIYSGIHQLKDIISNKNQENVILNLEFQTLKLEKITNKLNLQDLNADSVNGFSIIPEYEFQVKEKDRKIRDLQCTNTKLQDKIRLLLEELSKKDRIIKSLNAPIVDAKPAKKGILAKCQTTKPPKVLVKSKTVDEILDNEPAKLYLQIPKNSNKKKHSKSNFSLKDCGPALQDELENPQSIPKSPRPIHRKHEIQLEADFKTAQELYAKSLPLD